MLGPTCLRVLAYVLQAVGTLLALSLIFFGYHIITYPNSNGIGLSTAFMYIGFAAAAIIIFLWSFIDTYRRNTSRIFSLIIVLWLLIIGQIAVLYALEFHKSHVAERFSINLVSAWKEQNYDSYVILQYNKKYQCCGIYDYKTKDLYVMNQHPPLKCYVGITDYTKNNCIMKAEIFWLRLLNGFNIIGYVLVAVELFLSLVYYILYKRIPHKNDTEAFNNIHLDGNFHRLD